MDNGIIKVYCGEGKGKTQAAIGRALICASEGKEVYIVQFLKGRTSQSLEFMKRLEPEIQGFRFEKELDRYVDLSQEEREEEAMNICNGLNFAKKVVTVGGCDVLILDEILGLVDLNIATVEDIIRVIENNNENNLEIILTGRNMPQGLIPYVDYVSSLNVLKDNHTED